MEAWDSENAYERYVGRWSRQVAPLFLRWLGLPRGLAWAGILAGLSYIVIVFAFLIKGQQNMVFYIGGLVLGISYPTWAIWFGYLIGKGVLMVGSG